jgi:hypothetical protein
MKILKQSQNSLSLEFFLDKMSQLDRLLESSNLMSTESKKNIQWYCNYRISQYYKRYVAENPPSVIKCVEN